MGAQAFGVDIGGTGIKGAVVDLEAGTLASERYKLRTPSPATPKAVAAVVAQVVDYFGWEGPIGCTFPGVVQAGVTRTAANVHGSWIGTPIETLLEGATGRRTTVVNDADAAGMAEGVWGAARGVPGLVIVTTLGTGIGSALLHDGVLIPNSELGHVEVGGEDAERHASYGARERERLSWQKWAGRLQRYYSTIEALLWPELIVVGGGVSRKADKFLPLLRLRTPVVPAALRNEAGIVGVAMLAAQRPGADAMPLAVPPAGG